MTFDWLLILFLFVFLLFRLHELYKKLSIRIGILILSPTWPKYPNHLGQPLRGTDNLIFFSLLIFLLFFSFLFFFVDVLYRLSLREFLSDLSWDKARTTKLTRKPLTNFLVDCIADTGETLTGLARWIFYWLVRFDEFFWIGYVIWDC